jgi:hypothetical protein
MPVQKKVVRKLQHREAIKGYEEWCKKHPKATHKEKFDQFDMFVDTSVLIGEKGALQTTTS